MTCRTPFDRLYLLPTGYTTCCQSWLHASVPFFDNQALGPWQAWNHPNFQALRRRVLDKDFSTCRVCPRVMNEDVPEDTRQDWKPVMDRGPAEVILTNDLVCNLHCWSCRKSAIGRDHQTEQRRETAMLQLFEQFQRSIRMVQLLQSGEALASPMHLRWLKSVGDWDFADNFHIELTTNGTLLTRKWGDIEPAHRFIKKCWISVDAASKETYEKVRLGGKWEDVVGGMRLMSDLKRSGSLHRLQLLFVVQAANFREIPAFIRMASELGAGAGFIPIIPWWQSKDQILPHCPSIPSHPQHAEYLKVLECDELRWPGVEASDLIGKCSSRQLKVIQ